MPKKTTYDELLKKNEALEKKAHALAVVEDALNYRIAFEKLIMDISSRFINLPTKEISKGIDQAIRIIGHFVDVDRTYIFKYQAKDNTMDNTHEWCNTGIEPHILRLKNIPLDNVPWLTNQINEGKVVPIPRVDDLPDEAVELREENQRQGTKSSLMVPMEYGGNVIGFLGLDSVREVKNWSEDVIGLLKIVGEILANAMERKRSEEALRISEEKYRTILETVEDGCWEVDLAGDFTFVNPAMCAISDRSYEELIGTSGSADANEKTQKRMTKVFTRVFMTGKNEKLTDFEMVTPNGARKVIEMSVSLIHDGQGNAIGFRGVSRDVTLKKEAEEALRASEERYRMVLEANPDPVVVLDIDAKVEYFNPMFSHVFGWSLEELKGKWLTGFMPKGKRAEIKGMFQKIISGENFYGFETQRLNKSGELIPVSISGSSYKDINGKPVGGIITFQDIREKKRMEAQLFNAQKFESIGTLAGGIAHDFNNLLMGIQGNVSLALFDLSPEHPHYELFQNIENNVKSGSRLTSQLLGYARKGRYEVKPLNLNKLVRDIAETFARTRKEIIVTHELADDLLPVEADEGQIEQVFLNFLVNSGQAMPKGGKIFIKTQNVTHETIDDSKFKVKAGKYVLIQVADTGVGMNKETIAHIFEPFFTTKEMGRGTGLGLASSYGIIKGHRGYVTVDSEKGKGASFNVYLPATEKTVSETDRIVKKALPGDETIFLIDDEKIVLDVGARIIERLGYKTMKCGDAIKAIEIYKKKYNDIQLVILDIIMPNMNGGDVFDRIREINPKAKVLLSSGYSIDGHARAILDRGCNGFIQKPFGMGELSEKIREIMEQ